MIHKFNKESLKKIEEKKSNMQLEDKASDLGVGLKQLNFKESKNNNFEESKMYYWLGISLGYNPKKNIILVGNKNERIGDKLVEYIEDTFDIAVFSIDEYGTSTLEEVTEYFSKYNNIKDIYYNEKPNNSKDFVSNIFKSLKESTLKKDISKKEFKEAEVDIEKIIKDLQGNFSGSNESQLAGVELLKGLSISDDPKANEFMDKLNKATTEISKEVLGIEDKKEESVEKIETIANTILKEQFPSTKLSYSLYLIFYKMPELLKTLQKDTKNKGLVKFTSLDKRGGKTITSLDEDIKGYIEIFNYNDKEYTTLFVDTSKPNDWNLEKQSLLYSIEDFAKELSESNIKEKIDITEEPTKQDAKSFFEMEGNISFAEYLELNEVEAVISTTNSNDDNETSMDNGHRHTYEVDEMGNGVTMMVIPNEYPISHIHMIQDWIVDEVEDHIHTIYVGARGDI